MPVLFRENISTSGCSVLPDTTIGLEVVSFLPPPESQKGSSQGEAQVMLTFSHKAGARELVVLHPGPARICLNNVVIRGGIGEIVASLKDAAAEIIARDGIAITRKGDTFLFRIQGTHDAAGQSDVGKLAGFFGEEGVAHESELQRLLATRKNGVVCVPGRLVGEAMTVLADGNNSISFRLTSAPDGQAGWFQIEKIHHN